MKLLLTIIFVCSSLVLNAQGKSDSIKNAIVEDGFQSFFEFNIEESGNYIVYGYIDSLLSNDSIHTEGMHIVESNNGVDLAEVFLCGQLGEFSECFPSAAVLLKPNDSTLTILHYSDLPVGPKMSSRRVFILEQELVFNKSGMRVVNRKSLYKSPELDSTTIHQIIDVDFQNLLQLQANSKGNYLDDILGEFTGFTQKLLVCALWGDVKSQELLQRLQEHILCSKETIGATIYYSYLEIFNIVKVYGEPSYKYYFLC